MKSTEAKIVSLLVVLGIAAIAVAHYFLGINYLMPALGLVGCLFLYAFVKFLIKRRRINKLVDKYQDEETVVRIMNGEIWKGMTLVQLFDSLGQPVDIDEKVLKTKRKQTWKYHHVSGNRYKLRVKLDNDIVVGWDERL